MHTSAAKYIPTKIKTKYRVPWETLAVREKRCPSENSLQKLSKKTQQTQMP